ncbi:MAG: FtsX-like permease family protein, partial [Flavisolibacter sp.]|nr:FtsX-like permease family protein [Flavisolibacter sp.]
IDSLGDRRSEERSFASMIYFPKNGGTRLAQIRALAGEFPYYGALETEPTAAGKSFRQAQQALVDQTLMLQFGARIGDSVKVGNVTFAIAGTLLKAPGQTGFSSSIAPAVYIPLRYLEATGLSQKGSRINYRYYFKYDRPVAIQQVVDKIKPRLDAEGLNYETIETQKEDTARSFRDLTQFLALVGFIALLLGCIGVASAIHIYVREKIGSVAILRCLGAKASQTFFIYLIQILGIGFIGSVIGAALGTLIQQFLPFIVKDFLPITISTAVSWKAIGQGILLGIIISLLFALLPLVSIRRVSPLHTLRLSFQPVNFLRDPVRWAVYGLILLFVLAFTYIQLNKWNETIAFTLVVFGSLLVLFGMAALLMWLVRRFFPGSWSYLWRQGLSNLYRPNNQTGILVVSIGLGTTLICTLFFIQSILLNRVSLSASGNQPNMVLFDIQPKQKASVLQVAQQQGLPIIQTVPIVNMRLDAINDITAARLQKDSTIKMPRWLFSREYRVTFRDSTISSEKITEGKWRGNVESSGAVFISLEQGFARRNDIKIGDTMVFNVQGALIPTVVGSLREVDWNRIQTNFLVVFPKGVLEEAPQFHVLLTRVPSTEASARFQQLMVRQFPNVSMIDLGLVLNVLDDILNKIAFVIQFMALFSIVTGLVVLIASVLISKYQRVQESVLLRTLGASRRQIFAITTLEYLFLGALAAATGIFLSIGASWALAHYIFKTEFNAPLWPVLIVFISICLLTVLIGLMNSRSVLTKPPLEILRQEV